MIAAGVALTVGFGFGLYTVVSKLSTDHESPSRDEVNNPDYPDEEPVGVVPARPAPSPARTVPATYVVGTYCNTSGFIVYVLNDGSEKRYGELC